MKFIAEIGVNHLGSEALAINYCDFLTKTGVEAITLQVREDSFYDGSAPWKTALSNECYIKCGDIIKSSGKLFGIATADLGVARRTADLKPDFWKVLSWGIKDTQLIRFLVDTRAPVYISTGISDMTEIASVADEFGQQVQFIHTQLSTEAKDANLAAIPAIRNKTGCDVSFGLHCNNFNVINVAIAYRPQAVFFYVKDTQADNYPDGSYAIWTDEVDTLIDELRILLDAVGDGVKGVFSPKTLTHSDKPESLR